MTTAKPICRCGPARRADTMRPPSMPASAPAENGSATGQAMPPLAALAATPANETSAITASEVATTDCIARSV